MVTNELTFNIAVTIDAEDLINELGVDRAKQELATVIRRFLREESIRDMVSQYVYEVDMRQKGVVNEVFPVAVRKVKLEGDPE